ncbi:hypothetical protein BDR22DRAFT_847101 [Usnea florida]
MPVSNTAPVANTVASFTSFVYSFLIIASGPPISVAELRLGGLQASVSLTFRSRGLLLPFFPAIFRCCFFSSITLSLQWHILFSRMFKRSLL